MTTSVITDMLFQPLAVGDFVVYYSNIYRIEGLGKSRSRPFGSPGGFAPCRLMLVDASKTTRPVNKNTSDVVKVSDQQVEVWQVEKARQRMEYEERMRKAGLRP